MISGGIEVNQFFLICLILEAKSGDNLLFQRKINASRSLTPKSCIDHSALFF